jgi:hypothetical protein
VRGGAGLAAEPGRSRQLRAEVSPSRCHGQGDAERFVQTNNAFLLRGFRSATSTELADTSPGRPLTRQVARSARHPQR